MRESLPHAAGVTKRFETVSQNQCGTVSFLFAFFLLYPSICKRCTNISASICESKTEYPHHSTDYRNGLAKGKVFDKIIAKDRKTTAQQRKRYDTREENECEASPSSCRTGSSPGRTARPLWWRQRFLAPHQHLKYHLFSSGVRRSFAGDLAAVRGRQFQRQSSAERQEHLHPRRRLLHLPCPCLRPAGKG